MSTIRITGADAIDLRFPTSDLRDGSDAMHPDPDYSAAYVVLRTNQPGLEGHGLTFTIGRGNDLCVAAARLLADMAVGRTLDGIVTDFAAFWRSLASEPQMRWIGPEKGVVHLATAAVINAVWDLWAKSVGKPLWKLLVDLTPEELVSTIDFRYITDVLQPEEAVGMLQSMAAGKAQREEDMLATGYPAYTTSAGWLGYSDDKVRSLCAAAVEEGWTHFKIKVGADLADDRRRAAVVREAIGPARRLMMDANQRWDVDEAIDNMRALAAFDPWWIEEPTSPDDILGHAAIARSIEPIGVATGEQCQNRVVFKQLLQANAIAFCQLDSCRLGGVNECLAVMLMAKRFDVPVCPHAGGVGLCEYISHLVMADYVAISGTTENRVAEYVDHLHEHFLEPCVIHRGRYLAPRQPGYGITMRPETLVQYAYPHGPVWAARQLAAGAAR
ncbi:MAG: L-fuconate dehydratase [Phycisphaerales bacterium]|nr:L-fuconate dehydratase [Phycisphaerales bacterium]